jgi:hypothetical protein
LKPRFQADNDLRSAIRTGVVRRKPAIDFQSARDARLDGVPDMEVLWRAADQGRILISHDENSIPGHFRAFLLAGYHSPGMFLIPQGVPIGTAIESILLVWIASDAGEWENRMIWLPL